MLCRSSSCSCRRSAAFDSCAIAVAVAVAVVAVASLVLLLVMDAKACLNALRCESLLFLLSSTERARCVLGCRGSSQS